MKIYKMSKSPICKWDATFGIKDQDVSKVFGEEFMIELCKQLAKQWCFQLEKGENTGFIHYQMRINLIKKSRANKLLNDLASQIGEEYIKYFHLTPTNNNVTDFYSYIKKIATRIGNPHSDKDEDGGQIMTTQLKDFLTKDLRPYQQFVVDAINNHIQNPDFRSIYVIKDSIGSIGKSSFCEYLCSHLKIAKKIQAYNSMETMSSYVCSLLVDKNGKRKGKAPPAYIVDMPRSTKEEKLYAFLSGLETIKDGSCQDPRYASREVYFNRPLIFIFCNSYPPLDGISRDRWKCYIMRPNYALIRDPACPGLKYEEDKKKKHELVMIEDTSDNIIEEEEEEEELENIVCHYIPDKLDKLV